MQVEININNHINLRMRQYYQTKRKKIYSPNIALSFSQINPKNHLSILSLNRQVNTRNRNIQKYPTNKYSVFFPLKINLQKVPSKRQNIHCSRFESIKSMQQSSSKTKLIKDSQFHKHSTLIQHYSNNVFNPNFTSKNNTNTRRPQHSQSYDSQQQKQSLKQSYFQNEFPLTQSKRVQKRSNSIVSNMNATRRPHAKKKSINMGMLIKIKKNSLNQLDKNTVGVRHIEKLKISSQSCYQQLTLGRNKPSIKANSHCMSLKNAKKRGISSSMQVKGLHLQSIDPWEFQYDKVKNLADLQIIVKI